ncbi:MAG: hypothetical protein ACT4P2_16565 [Pseudomonadota bacterium]
MALLALVPLVAAADEPPTADEATIFGLTRQQAVAAAAAVAVALAVDVVGGAVVLTAVTGGGIIPALLLAIYVGHFWVEAAVVAAGGYWLWDRTLSSTPPPTVE